MSYSSNEDIPSSAEQRRKPDIVKKIPENLTPGRTNLRKWLGRSFRVVITDGRILIGYFNCTDKDANIVLSLCAEYLEEGGEPRILGSVMIPGKHIVSIDVERKSLNFDYS
ncbi:N-alpha-acetyltransferase 38, NatC auxiliary subunit isoform X2 [Condylostylus longicornis]|uniref:N-alpha-acetyltransferase 38, NatC auxiliary subunit isoform X2 n=1 Tax=Condylostylus longicornis TaxID=2530218 RepID=UPI00244E0AB9|nr:N-alpha-acetyltransferase 38, NatC auxiliary subunit isoform X2 [Condylostylus longicornis]